VRPLTGGVVVQPATNAANIPTINHPNFDIGTVPIH
jgi:hypothetical protein